MLSSVAHIGLTVSNLDVSIAFYRDILGLNYIGEMMMGGEETAHLFQKEGCQARVAYLKGTKEQQAPSIELIQFLGQPIEHHQGNLFQTSISEVCFYTDDIDQSYTQLKNAGVEFLSEPQTFDSIKYGFGKSRAVYFRDPDGIILELIQPVE